MAARPIEAIDPLFNIPDSGAETYDGVLLPVAEQAEATEPRSLFANARDTFRAYRTLWRTTQRLDAIPTTEDALSDPTDPYYRTAQRLTGAEASLQQQIAELRTERRARFTAIRHHLGTAAIQAAQGIVQFTQEAPARLSTTVMLASEKLAAPKTNNTLRYVQVGRMAMNLAVVGTLAYLSQRGMDAGLPLGPHTPAAHNADHFTIVDAPQPTEASSDTGYTALLDAPHPDEQMSTPVVSMPGIIDAPLPSGSSDGEVTIIEAPQPLEAAPNHLPTIATGDGLWDIAQKAGVDPAKALNTTLSQELLGLGDGRFYPGEHLPDGTILAHIQGTEPLSPEAEAIIKRHFGLL